MIPGRRALGCCKNPLSTRDCGIQKTQPVNPDGLCVKLILAARVIGAFRCCSPPFRSESSDRERQHSAQCWAKSLLENSCSPARCPLLNVLSGPVAASQAGRRCQCWARWTANPCCPALSSLLRGLGRLLRSRFPLRRELPLRRQVFLRPAPQLLLHLRLPAPKQRSCIAPGLLLKVFFSSSRISFLNFRSRPPSP